MVKLPSGSNIHLAISGSVNIASLGGLNHRIYLGKSE